MLRSGESTPSGQRTGVGPIQLAPLSATPPRPRVALNALGPGPKCTVMTIRRTPASALGRTALALTLTVASAAHADDLKLTGAAGVEVATSYLFRGIPQEDQGAITQPYAELSIPVVDRVTVSAGMWSSVHTGPTGHPDGPAGPGAWYEADAYLRASVALPGQLTVSALYTAYTSPNGSFATVHEMAGGLTWSDGALSSRLLGDRFLGFTPTVVVAREVEGTASGMSTGTYVGVSIRPSLAISRGAVPVTLALPVEVGLSAGGYYDDMDGGVDRAGMVAVGTAALAGLTFLPSRFGAWSAVATARAYWLGTREAAKTDGRNPLFASLAAALTF